MKITKTQLKQIIKEELGKVIREDEEELGGGFEKSVVDLLNFLELSYDPARVVQAAASFNIDNHDALVKHMHRETANLRNRGIYGAKEQMKIVIDNMMRPH